MKYPLVLSLLLAAVLPAFSACDKLPLKPKTAFNADSAYSYTKQQVAFGPRIVGMPISDWRQVIEEARACDPAVLVNTHFYAGDLAQFQLQLMERPINGIVYLQYGAMHQSFQDIAREKSVGIVVSTVIGLLRDEMGAAFQQKYRRRFGEASTPQVGCQPYSALHHYAIAASLAGGTGGPGEFDQNRIIASRQRLAAASLAGQLWQSSTRPSSSCR